MFDSSYQDHRSLAEQRLYTRRVLSGSTLWTSVTAHANIDTLYQGNRLQFKLDRTTSRLTEMQSNDYLHAAHLA